MSKFKPQHTPMPSTPSIMYTNLMSIPTDTPLSITVWVNVRLRLNPKLMLNFTTTPILDILDILTPLDILTALTSTTSTTVVSSREKLRLRLNPRLMLNSTTTPILDTLDILTPLDILDILTPLDTPTVLTLTTSTTVVSSREKLRLRLNLKLMPNTSTTTTPSLDTLPTLLDSVILIPPMLKLTAHPTITSTLSMDSTVIKRLHTSDGK